MVDGTLVLTGAAQRLIEAFTNPAPGSKDDIGMRMILLQGDGANANGGFIGGSNKVTSALYGWRIDKSAAGVPALGVQLGPNDAGCYRPSQVWVIGTAGEKLHILGQEY